MQFHSILKVESRLMRKKSTILKTILITSNLDRLSSHAIMSLDLCRDYRELWEFGSDELIFFPSKSAVSSICWSLNVAQLSCYLYCLISRRFNFMRFTLKLNTSNKTQIGENCDLNWQIHGFSGSLICLFVLFYYIYI